MRDPICADHFREIDYSTVTWAVHRLCGIVTPVNSQASAEELEFQLKDSNAKCLFTTVLELPTSIKAAHAAGIPEQRIYLFMLPPAITGGAEAPPHLRTLESLVNEGSGMQRLEAEIWGKGQGKRQLAYLSYSSGTGGLPVSKLRVFRLYATLDSPKLID